ncbi:MAG: hypothetical protein EPO01_01945 [Aquabacterium sp.]|nr:MAG: hypothetical protein EPO01_01945 [Aquabacterium sp.]
MVPCPLPHAAQPGLSRRTLLAALGLGGLQLRTQASPRDMHEPRELRVVTAGEPASQKAVLQALRQRFPLVLADSDPLQLMEAGRTAGAPAAPLTSPLVTIGPVALRRALESGVRAPLVAVFASSQACIRLIGEGPRERIAATAIYADAPPLAQLQLVSHLFERGVITGVLLSESSAYLERPLRQAAAQAGIDLLLEYVAPGRDAVRSLNRLAGAHVLLAVPDSTLYTAETLRSVLESTYRRGLPVIGFSAATVAAGTLAAAYPDIDDVVSDLSDLLDTLGGGSLPEPRYPNYWRVGVNGKVARSLGIAVSDKVLALGSRPPAR